MWETKQLQLQLTLLAYNLNKTHKMGNQYADKLVGKKIAIIGGSSG